MAVKQALVSFEFQQVKGLIYEPQHDHDFAASDPGPNESIQPVISKAFARIKKCVARSVNSNFNFGFSRLQNMNNYLFIAVTALQAELLNCDETSSSTSSLLTMKFYRLFPSIDYKVTIDIEEMPNSTSCDNNLRLVTHGLTNMHIATLAGLLDFKFKLDGRIEFVPLIKRGLYDVPRYVYSSDHRILEYDYDEIIYQHKSDYQDIKILHSASLGNQLLLDNRPSQSENDIQFTWAMMDRDIVEYKDKSVLILGGGDGCLLHDTLAQEPRFVTMVEIDAAVIDACRTHMHQIEGLLDTTEGPKHQILIDDCKHMLREYSNKRTKFDIILNDLTTVPRAKRGDLHQAFEPNSVQKSNYWHFIEPIFNLALECLSSSGCYITKVTGKADVVALEEFEDFLMNSSYNLDYEARESYVPSLCEVIVFYTIRKRPAQLLAAAPAS